ncbi:MAG: helix-turn-helix transcriptional regulator [Clostridia bacterium]|nr:helix-turn-helix transcriptional regulator [Clostridia bacterium]
MALSEKIFTLRKKSGLSQEQLAEHLGVSRQAISKWESGSSMPESEKLIAICDYFDVSLDYLMRDCDEAGHVENAPPQTSRAGRGFIIGIVSAIGGALAMIVWGILSVIRPEASSDLATSSAIRIDGNGIFLMFCIAAIVLGAALLLSNTKKR